MIAADKWVAERITGIDGAETERKASEHA